MIFARRALQRRLDELRISLPAGEVDALISRLNKIGRDRMAAMWEVVVIHALACLGQVRLEAPLTSGRRPDIAFRGPLAFTTDVTTVSDEGLDDANPVRDFMDRIESAKTKLGLPIGGLDLRVEEETVKTARGTSRRLRLPPRARLDNLIRDRVTPELKRQMEAGTAVLSLTINDADAAFSLAIDPSRAGFNTGGYAPYATPTIKDDNPLYRALKSKAKQLKGAEGLTGVIVGDASASAMRMSRGRGEVGAGEIALEFLRQHSSIGFVLLLTIEETSRPIVSADPPKQTISPLLIMRPDDPAQPALSALVREAVALMPAPTMMPVNGAMRAQEPGYDLGSHGAYKMSDKRIQVSARELMETLAGLRTFGDDGAKYVEARRKQPSGGLNSIEGAFLRKIMSGELPTRIAVIKGGENDNDDWVEFEFGPKDPAISPLK